jgi:ATP-dependent 26S proteasome regulatory subunit
MSTEEVVSRTRLLDNEVKIMKSEVMRISHELQAQKEKIKENTEKIKVNKTLPYLVSNVIELLDVDPQDLGEEDGANVDLDSQRKGKCAVIKTSTRQVNIFIKKITNCICKPICQWFTICLPFHRLISCPLLVWWMLRN